MLRVPLRTVTGGTAASGRAQRTRCRSLRSATPGTCSSTRHCTRPTAACSSFRRATPAAPQPSSARPPPPHKCVEQTIRPFLCVTLAHSTDACMHGAHARRLETTAWLSSKRRRSEAWRSRSSQEISCGVRPSTHPSSAHMMPSAIASDLPASSLPTAS